MASRSIGGAGDFALLRCTFLFRSQVQGLPSLASPFAAQTVHWTASSFRLTHTGRVFGPPDRPTARHESPGGCASRGVAQTSTNSLDRSRKASISCEKGAENAPGQRVVKTAQGRSRHPNTEGHTFCSDFL
jgi:hypothetical protein